MQSSRILVLFKDKPGFKDDENFCRAALSVILRIGTAAWYFLYGIIFNSARLASSHFMVGSWLIKPVHRRRDL
ncbi:hypothetical protein D3C81_1983210 [compost metagenome]